MKLELNKVYRARNSTEWKIICNDDGICYHGINKKQDRIEIFWPNTDGSKGIDYDLIELVGDDFTEIKEPRNFQFEGYISEQCCQITDEGRIINRLLDRSCSPIMSTEYGARDFSTNPNDIISKWKITMEELPK